MLGSSLLGMGGSAVLSKTTFSALRREVHKILGQKRRAIASFEDERLQAIITKFTNMAEVKEIDKRFTTLEGQGPFSSLLASCRAELTELQNSELLVSIFGTLKVGKSTLGNRLLERQRFASADTPLTSFATTVHSSAEIHAKASFVPFIESALDIKSLLLVAGIDDPELEKQYTELWNNKGHIDGDTLPEFLTRPRPELRYTPIISRLDLYGPIWDIAEPGIAIADCPGTKEIGTLSNIAHTVATDSAVIVYLCDGHSQISDDDEDVCMIRDQLKQGADVLFVINKKPDIDDVARVADSLIKTFGTLVDFKNSPIHIFDVMYDNAHLELLQKDLSARLHQRTRAAVSLFLNFFTEYIRAQHLFVSRLLTLHVMKQAEATRNRTPARTADPSRPMSPSRKPVDTKPADATQAASTRHKKEVQVINMRLKNLWRACQGKIDEASRAFNESILETVDEFEKDLRHNDEFEKVPVPIKFEDGNHSPQSFLGSVFNPQETEFEREFRRQLQMRLQPILEHKLNTFGKKAKRDFTAFLSSESSSIESSVIEIKSEQARLVWNRQTAGLFSTLQKDLNRVSGDPKKVAGVAFSAAGLVGAATLGGVAMAGVLAGVVLTGGALLVVSLAVTGFGLSAASLWKDKRAETSERASRKRVLARMTESIKKSLSNNEQWNAYRQQTVKSLEATLAAAVHVLSTNLIEIESIWYLDQCALNITYESLCDYLWLRDELTDVTTELVEAIRIVDENLKVSETNDRHSLSHSSSSMSSPMTLSPYGINLAQDTHHDACYVCWRPRTSCGHLCRDCDFLIGAEHCPYCHELPNWISNKIKLSPQAKHDLEALIRGAPPSTASVPFQRRSSAVFLVSDEPISSYASSERHLPGHSSLTNSASSVGSALSSNSAAPSSSYQLPLDQSQEDIHFLYDDQKARVRGILMGFQTQFVAFCNWFESKFSRYITETPEPSLDVPQEVLICVKYFVNSIIAQTPSIDSNLSYSIKLKIVECVHETLFDRIGPLVENLVRSKFRLLDEDHQKVAMRGRQIDYENRKKDWSPARADSLKMQQAIDTFKSLHTAKTPFAKFEVWKQVWRLIHEAHKEIIASDESWAALAYVVFQAANPHMPSDGYIIDRSLDLLLEGEGYMMTTILSFSNSALISDVVTAELANDRRI